MKRRHVLIRAAQVSLGLPGTLVVRTAAAKARTVTLGQQPGLTGTTLRSQPFDLRRMRGRVVLVVFWSTEIAACRDLMPELRAAMADWGDKPFQLVAVSQDRRLGDVLAYQDIVEKVATPMQQFPQLWRRAADYRDSFGLIADLPAAFLLDRDGRVVRAMHGAVEPAVWDEIARLTTA